MSLEKKSIHVRLDHDVHARLAVLADAAEKDMAELAALLLTRPVVGEFHVMSKAVERLNRLGLQGSEGE